MTRPRDQGPYRQNEHSPHLGKGVKQKLMDSHIRLLALLVVCSRRRRGPSGGDKKQCKSGSGLGTEGSPSLPSAPLSPAMEQSTDSPIIMCANSGLSVYSTTSIGTQKVEQDPGSTYNQEAHASVA